MQNQLGYIYWGLGLLLTPIGTIRLGRNNFEFGKLNSSAYGVAGLLRAKNSYVALGPCVGTDYGLYTGMGYEPDLSRNFTFRAEVSAIVDFHGRVGSEVLAGLVFHD